MRRRGSERDTVIVPRSSASIPKRPGQGRYRSISFERTGSTRADREVEDLIKGKHLCPRAR